LAKMVLSLQPEKVCLKLPHCCLGQMFCLNERNMCGM
jgi:hypothetical protein